MFLLINNTNINNKHKWIKIITLYVQLKNTINNKLIQKNIKKLKFIKN